jgi:predicted nucleic acid-binding protein
VSVFVIDASVVVKWFVPEIYSDAARRLLELPHEYVAPDLLFAETANTIWKKIRREELTAEEGQQLVADIGQIAVETISCRALAEDAHALASATGRTVYDSMYIALAVRLNTRAITADERLESALKRIPAVAGHLQLVQTFERDVQDGQAANAPQAPE